MRSLIGTVTAYAITASLFTDGRWEVSTWGKLNPDASLAFASLYGTLGDSPSDGRPGSLALHRAAQDLYGIIEMTPAPPAEVGIVY